MRFHLDIQFFASKKGVGSTKNGRDSHAKRLGAKLADGQYCHAGSVIYRQRGTKIHPGTNVGRGGDDTLFAKVNGIVKYERMGKDRKKYLFIQLPKHCDRKYGDASASLFSLVVREIFFDRQEDYRKIGVNESLIQEKQVN